MSRRGELAELESALKALAGRGSASVETRVQRRELFRRVLAFQTLAVDLSPLFPTMLLNAATADVPTKKMLYHYVVHCAATKPDLALLVVNTLVKDAGGPDPTIRALALRSLASLRVPALAEYAVDAVVHGLKDKHPYGRRSAALAVLKLHDLAPQLVAAAGLLPTLRGLLVEDPAADVAANALAVLRETDGLPALATQPILYSLLNRIKLFSDWGQCLVLELAAAYKPENPEEMYNLMNLLEDRLRSSNSAIVLATVNVFLHLTLGHADVHQAVYERIKAPLYTLAASGSGECAYAVWAHLHLLVCRAPVLFAMDYRQFFVRASDSQPVKRLKLEMLTAVADEHNTYDIVTELSEYVTDVDVATSRRSVRAIGEVAVAAADVAGIVDRLLSFLDLASDYVVCEALVVVKDLLRRYPERADACVTAVSALDVSCVSEPHGRAAFAFIMGEYGHILPEAPYALEPLLAELKEEADAGVRGELLTAAVKLFLNRPAEMQRMLGCALAAGSADADAAVRDRALLYYRLLKGGMEGARAVVCGDRAPLGYFEEGQLSELRDRLFAEFNTTSVVYGQPAAAWLDGRDRAAAAAAAAAALAEDEGQPAALAEDSLLGQLDGEEESMSMPRGMSSPAVDFLSGGLPAATPPTASAPGQLPRYAPTPPPPAPPPTPSTPTSPELPRCPLSTSPLCDAASFQAHWTAWPSAQQGTLRLPPAGLAAMRAHAAALSPYMAGVHIATMASGGAPPALKWYFYASGAPDSAPVTFLAELLVDVNEGTASITIKSDAPELSKAFAANFAQRLLDFPGGAGALL